MSSLSTWRIRFAGQTLEGFSTEHVKDAIGRRFGADPVTLERLFGGSTVTLKRNLSRQQAEAFQRAMAKMGAHTELELDVLEPEDSQPRRDEQRTAPPAATPLAFSGQGAASEPGWRSRWHYRVDTFMARGGANIFKALLLVSVVAFALIAALRGILFLLFPGDPLQ